MISCSSSAYYFSMMKDCYQTIAKISSPFLSKMVSLHDVSSTYTSVYAGHLKEAERVEMCFRS